MAASSPERKRCKREEDPSPPWLRTFPCLAVRLDLVDDARYWFFSALAALEQLAAAAGCVIVTWHWAQTPWTLRTLLRFDGEGLQTFVHGGASCWVAREMGEIGALVAGHRAIVQTAPANLLDGWLQRQATAPLSLCPPLPPRLYHLLFARPRRASGDVITAAAAHNASTQPPAPPVTLLRCHCDGHRDHPDDEDDGAMAPAAFFFHFPGAPAAECQRRLADRMRRGRRRSAVGVVGNQEDFVAIDVNYDADPVGFAGMLRECILRFRPAGGVIALTLRLRHQWPALTSDLRDLVTVLYLNPLRHLCIEVEEDGGQLPPLVLEVLLGLRGGLTGLDDPPLLGLSLTLRDGDQPCERFVRDEVDGRRHAVSLPVAAEGECRSLLRTHGFSVWQ